MNERILELAKEAGFCHDINHGIYLCAPMHMEKFAELIVRECAQTLRDNTPVLDEYKSEEDWDRGYGQAMKDCVHHIQEHFGVER